MMSYSRLWKLCRLLLHFWPTWASSVMKKRSFWWSGVTETEFGIYGGVAFNLLSQIQIATLDCKSGFGFATKRSHDIGDTKYEVALFPRPKFSDTCDATCNFSVSTPSQQVTSSTRRNSCRKLPLYQNGHVPSLYIWGIYLWAIEVLYMTHLDFLGFFLVWPVLPTEENKLGNQSFIITSFEFANWYDVGTDATAWWTELKISNSHWYMYGES